MNTDALEEAIQYTFVDKNFLREALTHRSYLNENPSWRLPHNERLEFLGDAVLELIVTEELFNRYPDYAEGQLTSLRAALVNYQMLAKIARDLGLEAHLLMSRGEAKDTGRAREVILANAFESLIGAVYSDGGYEKTRRIVDRFLMSFLDEVVKQGLYRDAKSMLQEKIQKEKRITPHYQVHRESGPDHAKTFIVGVYFGEQFVAEGEGQSKHEAELEAAKKALEQATD